MGTQPLQDEPIAVASCPHCHGPLEAGFVNAPSWGVVWTTDPSVKWFPLWSRSVKRLQKDWWGFHWLAKDRMPGLRCPKCRLVIFRYTNPNV